MIRTAETCREFIELLSAYVDGELSEDVRFRFDAHVAACPACSAYLESYEATVKLAKAALSGSDDPVPAEVPEDLVKAILAARRKE